jgi:hypothetical protein
VTRGHSLEVKWPAREATPPSARLPLTCVGILTELYSGFL